MKISQFTTNLGSKHQLSGAEGRRQENHSQEAVVEQITREINKKDVELAVNNLNNFLEPVSTNLKFVFHEDLQDYYVTIVDPITNEVVKEIPPKKMLDMYVAMAEYMGLLVDEKV